MHISRPARPSLVPTAALAAAFLVASAGSAAGPAAGDDPLLVSSTYLGGSGDEWPGASAMGKDGALWIVATSSSTDIPGAARPPQPVNGLDVAVLRVDPATRRVLSVAWLGGASEDSGSSADVATALAFDDAGNAYIAGYTFTYDFPATVTSLSPFADSNNAFVARVRPDGSGFVWVRVLGGAYNDYARGICFAPEGDPVVVGFTVSHDFPTVGSPPPSSLDSGGLFVTRLLADGSGIVFSSLFGGLGYEDGGAIATLPDGGFLVAGATNSTDFATRGPLFGDPVSAPGWSAFLAEIDASGTVLRRAALLGSTEIRAISVEAAGTILLAGTAYEADDRIALPARDDPGDDLFAGNGDAVVLRLDATTWDLVGGVFVGGSSAETGLTLAKGSDGMLWLTGVTSSTDLPVPGAVRFRRSGWQDDAFVAAFDPADLSVDFATYLGGTGGEWLPQAAPAADGSAWIVGSTSSFDFPERDAPHARAWNSDLFVTRLLHGDPAARPGKPSPFAVDVMDGPAVRLRWNAAGGGPEQCFVVERKEMNDFERMTVLPAGTTEWTDTSVLPDRGYSYLLQAVGDAGASPPTQAVRVLTPASLEFRVDRGRSRFDRRIGAPTLRLEGKITPVAGASAGPDLRRTGIQLFVFTPNGPVPAINIGPDDPRWRTTRRRIRWQTSHLRLDFHPATGAFDLRVRGFDFFVPLGAPVAIRIEAGTDAATTSTTWRADERNGLLTP